MFIDKIEKEIKRKENLLRKYLKNRLIDIERKNVNEVIDYIFISTLELNKLKEYLYKTLLSFETPVKFKSPEEYPNIGVDNENRD